MHTVQSGKGSHFGMSSIESAISTNTTSKLQPLDLGIICNFNLTPPPPKIKSFQGAISTLEDVKYFFESSDYFNLASSTSSLIDNVACQLT